MLLRLLFPFSLLLLSLSSWASPCCGGASALPSLILGDHYAQFNSAIGYSWVAMDALEKSYLRRERGNQEIRESLSIEATYRPWELWQASLRLTALQQRKTQGDLSDSGSGISEVALGTSYEFLPEYTYSLWRPRGFLYVSTGIPISTSIHQAEGLLSADAISEPYYNLRVGSAFVKTFRQWDGIASIEYNHRIPTQDSREFLDDSFVLSSRFGLGWSLLSQIRLGVLLAPSVFRQTQNGEPSLSYHWDTSFMLNYTLNSHWIISSTYQDQTLLGPAQDRPLERQFSILVQRRWLP